MVTMANSCMSCIVVETLKNEAGDQDSFIR